MKFADVKKTWGELSQLLREDSGKQLLDEVTVTEPSGVEDELHFLRLLNWCYVALNEAGQVPVRYLQSLLRTGDPEANKIVGTARRDVDVLRTQAAHNLSAATLSNELKARQAKVWLFQNGGTPTDWGNCCRALCVQVQSAVRALCDGWKRVGSESEDRRAAIAALLSEIERHWAPHEFDAFVAEATNELNIDSLDIVSYRNSHLEEWRLMTTFFTDRAAAERHMRIHIRNDLARAFT